MLKTKSGFTLVELLIVIVIIAILAAITIVAYNGISARANDSSIRSGATQFAKAVINWHTLTGSSTPLGGYGSTVAIDANGLCTDGTGGGWVASGMYKCSIEDELIAQKLLPTGFTATLPKNNKMNYPNGRESLMFYPCNLADRSYVVLYYLNSPSDADVANYNSLASTCKSSSLMGSQTSYGMQGAILVSLS